MANTKKTAALGQPPQGEIVSNEVLYLHQFSAFRLAEAFAGQQQPTVIWQEMIRESPQAILYYRELEEKDEDVAGALEDLKLSVLKRERRIVPADDSSAAQDAAALIQQQTDALPNFHQVLDGLLDAAGYGFALSELMFDVSMGQVALIDARDCPQELFSFGPRFYPQIGPLRFLKTVSDVDGIEVPENKFAVFTYRMRSRNRRGRPLMRSVFWPSWFKRNMTRFWLRYGERGPGTAITRYKNGATDDEKRQALAAAEMLVERQAGAVPEGMLIESELLQIARSMNPAVYQTLCERMELKIYRRINGQTLTSHGSDQGAGTQALGSVHESVQETRGIELARALEQVVNRQIIAPLTLWNFGPNVAPPKLEFDTSEAEDLARRVTVDRTLQVMGKKFTAGYINQRYDTPAVEGEDEKAVLAPSLLSNTLRTPDGSPDSPVSPNFEEPQHVQDWKEFDQIFEQLKQGSLEAYAGRAKDVAQGAAALATGGALHQ